MRIGVVKEIKDKENRVALTPEGASQLIDAGHSVIIQQDAGLNSGFPDHLYEAVGCTVSGVSEAWNTEMVLKIKEPLESEYHFFTSGQIIFTYFHLAGVAASLTEHLLERQVSAIAYETVRDDQGKLPLLAPMSGVAGTMSVSIANTYLARSNNGKGALLGSVLGKPHGKIVIIGDGVVGQHAVKAAMGIGAHTFVFTRHEDRFAILKGTFGECLNCVLSSDHSIREHLRDADAVIGSVLIPGARAPSVVSEQMVKDMQPGSVIVDVSIDQGGCIATSRPTTHSDPVYRLHDVIHYCVTNMPGAYPLTSTAALTTATIPYTLLLAENGISAVKMDEGLAAGVNTFRGSITDKAVAEALGMIDRWRALEELLP